MRWTRFDAFTAGRQCGKTLAGLDLVANARLCGALCEILMEHAGERGDPEGAVECLERIIAERDASFTVIMKWIEVPDQSDYIDELQQEIDELDVERTNMRLELHALQAENQRLRDDRPVIGIESNSDHDKVTVTFRGLQTSVRL